MVIDNYYRMLVSDRSFLFNDIRTSKIIEKRDDIFKRAFLNSMRFLNEFYGPIMNDWKWGKVHNGRYFIPLLKDGSFFNKTFSKQQNAEVSGGNSTILRGAINANRMMGANKVSCVSGIFLSDLTFASLSISSSLDPQSKYYKNYNRDNKLISLNSNNFLHRLILVPSRNRSNGPLAVSH